MMFKIYVFSFYYLLINFCIYGGECLDVDCSDHGDCEENNGIAYCVCDAGYFADNLYCVPERTTTSQQIILNPTECSKTGHCIYRSVFSTWFNLDSNNESEYDILININHPDDSWTSTWETLTECLTSG